MNAPLARKLSRSTLASLDSRWVSKPGYDIDNVSVGVLHIGLGAFNRAHQMDYFDRLLHRDSRWGVCGVSMNSRAAVDALAAQDGLYTLALLDDYIKFKIIGAVRETAMAQDDLCTRRLAAATTTLVTLTITEKGYCLDATGQLDFSHPDIEHDLVDKSNPRTAIGLLVRGLKARMVSEAGGLDVLSCDNLSDNGTKLQAAILAFADQAEPGLSSWIIDNVCFPNSLVDAITPATDDALRQRVVTEAGINDRWPIQREGFSAWVIERPDSVRSLALADAGVVFTSDARAHAKAKLRLLNGAHSVLAYLGLAMGKQSVAGAMQDKDLATFIERMLIDEIKPHIAAAEGLNLGEYCAALLHRFRNTALVHKLSQIAWDGSQKLPIRILATIEDAIKVQAPIDRLCIGVAAWMRFVRRTAQAGDPLTDPLAIRLMLLAGALNDEGDDVDQFLTLTEVFPATLRENEKVRQKLKDGYHYVLSLEQASRPDKQDPQIKKAILQNGERQ